MPAFSFVYTQSSCMLTDAFGTGDASAAFRAGDAGAAAGAELPAADDAAMIEEAEGANQFPSVICQQAISTQIRKR